MNDLRLSYDPTEFDKDRVLDFLEKAYWTTGRKRPDLWQAILNSECVGLFSGSTQLGMARAVTDKLFFAYIFDVLLCEPYRGRGLSHHLMHGLLFHPELKLVTNWMLTTQDAQGLYQKYGFQETMFGGTMWMVRKT